MDAEIAAEVLEWLREAKTLAESQAPVLAEEIVRYGRFLCVFQLLLAGAFMFLTGWVARHMYRQYKGSRDEDLVGVSVIPLVPGLLAVWGAVSDMQAWIAPRFYVIQELSDLIGG